MKNTLRITGSRVVAILLVVITILGLFDTSGFTAYAVNDKKGMVYLDNTESLLQTYASPSTNADGVSKLVYGKPVTVLDQVKGEDGEKWYQITYYIQNGAVQKTAYCHTSNILLDENAIVTATGKSNANNVTIWSCTGAYQQPALATINSGAKVEILDSITDDGVAWYRIRCKVDKNTYVGWVKSQYISKDAVPDIETDEEYEDYLVRIGFPKSYVHNLAVLHEIYPNWVFEPFQTGLDWETVIAEEAKAGRNLVYKTTDDAKKSMASTEYNWKTNTWVIRDSSGWVTAHPEYIAYCMDPRNFLNETNIFMFESLSYSENHNIDGVMAVIKNTFMANDIANGDGTMLNYANAFMSIGKALGVSPYHLASRVRQEQGAGTSPLISGKYSGYEGYYNYFNINAYGTPTSVLYANGLSYAKNKGWNTRYKSILGGSEFIAQKYIGVGQDTLYTQKFDVVKEGGLYYHQYMTNVEAAISEGRTVARAYTDKSQAFVFKIPVYNNMPKKAVEFNVSGNRNNYLKDLSISGVSLTPSFSGEVNKYSVIVGTGVSSVSVSASAAVDTSTISGTGTYNLEIGSNTIKVNCKSQSGEVRTYDITIVREGSKPSEDEKPAYTLQSNVYKLNKYITGVEPSTLAKDFLSGFQCEGGTLKVLTADNKENTGTVATGNKLAVYVNGTLVAAKEIVIYGDANGDGLIDVLDIIRINRHTLNISPLKGAYLEAGDANRKGDGADVLDIIITNRHTLKLAVINQK